MLVWLLLGTTITTAAEPAAEEPFAEARRAEQELRYDDAIAACGRVLELSPGGSRAPACRVRIAYLEARRDADGSFGALAALESVRRRWRTDDPAALATEVEALARRPGLSPTLAEELAAWLARDALDRLSDPARALAVLDAAPPAEALPPEEAGTARDVAQLRALALARAGRVDAARATEAPLRVGDQGTSPVDVVLRDERRARGARVAAALLAASVLALLPASLAGWATRPRPIPVGLVPLAVAGLGAAALLLARGEEDATLALRLAVGAAAVHLVSLGALARLRDQPWPRRAVRVLAALATLALAWLALWSGGALDVIGA